MTPRPGRAPRRPRLLAEGRVDTRFGRRIRCFMEGAIRLRAVQECVCRVLPLRWGATRAGALLFLWAPLRSPKAP